MNNTQRKSLSPRKTFMKCGTCSRAMFNLMNQEFNNSKPDEEKAADLLAGGIALKGYQCGMLWGGTLAIGTESFHRFKDKNTAIVNAVNASRYLIDSFHERTKTVNCREITGVDWKKNSDKILFVLKTVGSVFVFSPCFNLMAKWTPEAIQAAYRGFTEKTENSNLLLSCATETLKKMGATDEESMMVAGFAGGIGLSGYGCGALSAAIWYKMLDWNRRNPGKTPDMFNNNMANQILDAFYKQTDSEVECNKICGRQFATIEEHSGYIKSGGCNEILNLLSQL